MLLLQALCIENVLEHAIYFQTKNSKIFREPFQDPTSFSIRQPKNETTPMLVYAMARVEHGYYVLSAPSDCFLSAS